MQPVSVTDSGDQKTSARSGQYRVMIVDDSAVLRGLTSKWLSQDPAIQVVGTAANGEMALRSMAKMDPEVIILDIEMPVMDGLTALPKLLQVNPDVKILMSSTLTKRNAEISMRALSMGASDYVAKPESNREVALSLTFQQELISKVINIAAANRRKQGGIPFAGKTTVVDQQFEPVHQGAKNIEQRGFARNKSSVLAIGSSTGGPQALLQLLKDLENIDVPVLVTQHMPPAFTKILAKHLTHSTNFQCKEAEDGEIVENGKVYIAPGDYHMTVVEKDRQRVISLNQEPPENFCRPSVEPMFRSLIDLYGSEVFAVILTGMGHDGLEACRRLAQAGGKLIAQDEKTSVVWGMPGAVCNAGLCNGVYPLNEIGAEIKDKMMGSA